MSGPTATAGVVGGRCFGRQIEPPRQWRAAPLLPSLSKEGTLAFHQTWSGLGDMKNSSGNPPFQRGKQGETTAVVNTTAVVKLSGGCHDGVDRADRTTHSRMPLKSPLSKGDAVFIERGAAGRVIDLPPGLKCLGE